MPKKIKKLYSINKEIKEEIIFYCYEVLKSINKDYLIENEIYENEFLEAVFIRCEKKYKNTGKFDLTKEEIVFLIHARKQFDKIVDELKSGNAKLIGIEKKCDELIFEFKNKETFKNFTKLQ